VTPGLPFGPHPCNPFCLGREPKARVVTIFVDDLNIHNGNWEEHLQHLDVVFSKLEEVNLKLTPNKCCFVAKKSRFWVMWLMMKTPN
jgi:hypothetical protein